MSQGYATQAATDICTEATVKQIGLNVWASGVHGPNRPEVDVVAVQGLRARPYSTWVPKKGHAKQKPRSRPSFNVFQGRQKNAQADEISADAPTASDTADCMWLRDLLPNLFPSARIATYGYESHWLKEGIDRSLRKYGEQLLNVLLQNRSNEEERQRPLVFIGHSLGGLVIKQALVMAVHGNNYRDVRLSTAGIIFLGTPHQGSEAAEYGERIAHLVGHRSTVLETLKRNNDSLYGIAQDFEKSYGDTDIVCFYEDKATSYGPLRNQTVDHQSASLLGKKAIYLNTDHSGLNKFHGPKDENFLLVQPEIQRLVQKAPQKIEERYRLHAVNLEKKSFHVDFSLKGIPAVEKFVARKAEMKRLTQALLPTSTDRMRRKVFIVHGLGGIGKTQLSVEFTRKHQRSYSAVFWINGSSKEILRRSIADVASRIPQHQLPERSRNYSQNRSASLDEAVEDVLEWLSQPLNDQWLLILDNVDREISDPEAFNVKEYFPTADQGSILITSRLASLSQLGQEMKLEPVDEEQGEIILRNSAGQSVKDSRKLVNLLQGLPLAINQAGSYMRMTGTNVSEYIELYDQAWNRLMEEQHRFTSEDRSILTTWTLSYDNLRSQSEAAANLLILWSFLDNQDLWYELLAPALRSVVGAKLPHWFASCAGDKLEFKERMGLLLGYSFIDAKIESSSFSMHPVLHHWCFHKFEEHEATMCWLAVIVVASAVPLDNELHNSLIGRRLLPHCDRVYSTLLRHTQEASWNVGSLRNFSIVCGRIGNLYSEQGRMKEAEALYLRSLTGSKDLDPEHTSTLDIFNNLGNLYLDQGKMKDAEDMYRRALTGFEKALDPEHTSTLNIFNNLGNLYLDQGKMKDAEDMYQRALTGYEKALGPEHMGTLDTRYNLGLLYKKRSMFENAVQQFELAVQGSTNTLGPEHKKTVSASNALESVKSIKREAEALRLVQAQPDFASA